MKALIIAAGNGSRMQLHTRSNHKCLMPLLGLRIIERIILAAKEADISEFVIVTGYKGENIRNLLKDGKKYGVSISYVKNTNWRKANGISVYKARKFFSQHFVLLMADHVFDANTLRLIQRSKLKANESILAVDRNLDSVNDISDTTKVKIKNNRIIALNKELSGYNGFDTGMFICSPNIFTALEKSIKQYKNSLSDGMRLLVQQGLLKAFNIRGNFWADCDTYRDIKFTERKLIKSLTKSEDGVISKFFNRKISGFITRVFLINTPLTPNMITVINPILAIFTFLLLSTGVYPWIFIGGLLIQFMSIFDGCDGEIARLKFLKSDYGAFFDAVIDKYVDTAIIAGMAYGYWVVTQNTIILPISLFIILSLILEGYMQNKYKVLTNRELTSVGVFYKRDIRLLILTLGAITNQMLLSLLILLFLLNYVVIARLIAAKKLNQ